MSTGTLEERVIQASEVETIIRAGEPAEFDKYIIEGDLNLCGLTIERPVHFNQTIFQDSVMFNSTTFNGYAYFWSSDFNGYVNFGSSVFNGYANFGSSVFNGFAYFGESDFNGYADFKLSKFKEGANFGYSHFNGYANFGYSDFNNYANFAYSEFNSTADFGFSSFNDDVSFVFSDFNTSAFFMNSEFNGEADFYNSKFNGDTSFCNSEFNCNANFKLDTFDKEANFNDVVFKGDVSFYSSFFNGVAFFEKTIIQGRLSLTKTKYDKLFIRWYNIVDGLEYDDAAYMTLLKNFKDLGYLEDYDSCYFQYRKEHRGQPWPGIGSFEVSVRKFLDIFLEYFYGYGKKPLLPLAWSLGVVLVFGIYWRSIGQKKQKIIFDEYSPKKNKINNKLLILIYPFLFSVNVFLSGTKLFVDPPEVPDTPGNSQSTTKFVFILERILGAFFSILFFLAVSGTVVR
ncbi:MAG TPA: pentapeptide repeat-containing protein [Methanothrix soehngenii]|nr:pentapeptide repeat-containing protein [Methanothrix soehngenii]